ncbi:MAG TPA: hypothetical protein VJT09_01405 [Pyrinomonadaceae bacterium]|nr:hypothetical protein [Pyrinomonadaceae bacterium]
MRTRRITLVSLLTAALVLPSFFGGVVAKPQPTQEGYSKGTVLFTVYAPQPPTSYMVPFVIIENGQFKQPIAGDSDEAEMTSFSNSYYPKGRKYRVLFGGAEAGSLTVKKSNKDEECSRSGADVTLRSTARLNRNVMALATNSDSLGAGKSTRRSPTAAERAALMPLVQVTYKEKGVPAALLHSLMTVNLTALDLDNDGKSELIGSFVVKKQKGGPARYALFLFAEPQGKSYRTTVLQYEQFTDSDLMSGADIDAIENGVYLERLIDGLDLDGDGTSEVITERDGFEGDSYFIYKKQAGKWNKIYEFSNYRCAF